MTAALNLDEPAAGWRALGRAVDGDVVLPGDDAFEAARRPAIARFDTVRPQGIVSCATVADVVEAIGFARRAGLVLAVRAGGHCFSGRSSTDGLLVDLRPMRSVAVDGGVVSAGAGAQLADLYGALEPHGLAVAAGCGPTVGVTGLVLGGGLGILGRTYGLTSDQLASAQVVLADGRIVECSDYEHPDLFWALRGAGGCQFGVVTKLALRTRQAPRTTTIHLRWPDRDAVAVADAWQRSMPDAPDELAASLLVTAGPEPGVAPVAHVFGALLGGRAEALEHMDELVARAGAEPAAAELHELSFHAAKRFLAENGPGGEEPAGAHGYQKSEFFRRSLPRAAVGELLGQLASGREAGEVRVLDFTPWGGAYNRVAEHATAFAHRSERFLLKHDVSIPTGATEAQRGRALERLRRSWAIVHPWGSGRVYPNFPDPELEDWAPAYHGANLGRLSRVKAAYDPANAFRFPQSVPPL